MRKRISYIEYNNNTNTLYIDKACCTSICYNIDGLYCMAEPIQKAGDSFVYNINVENTLQFTIQNVRAALLFIATLFYNHDVNYILVSKKWKFFNKMFKDYIVTETISGTIYKLCPAAASALISIGEKNEQ